MATLWDLELSAEIIGTELCTEMEDMGGTTTLEDGIVEAIQTLEVLEVSGLEALEGSRLEVLVTWPKMEDMVGVTTLEAIQTLGVKTLEVQEGSGLEVLVTWLKVEFLSFPTLSLGILLQEGSTTEVQTLVVQVLMPTVRLDTSSEGTPEKQTMEVATSQFLGGSVGFRILPLETMEEMTGSQEGSIMNSTDHLFACGW